MGQCLMCWCKGKWNFHPPKELKVTYYFQCELYWFFFTVFLFQITNLCQTSHNYRSTLWPYYFPPQCMLALRKCALSHPGCPMKKIFTVLPKPFEVLKSLWTITSNSEDVRSMLFFDWIAFTWFVENLNLPKCNCKWYRGCKQTFILLKIHAEIVENNTV